VRAAIAILFFIGSIPMALALDPQTNADVWLTNAPALPEPYANATPQTNRFTSLKAEVIAGKLRMTLEGGVAENVRLIASADAPGHWPARDWRTYPMRRAGKSWIGEVPVDSLYVPIIYFAMARDGANRSASAMRIVRPDAMDLEQPTRLFWPFIEGFEQELDGWRRTDGVPLRTAPVAKNGQSSLAIVIPPRGRSVTLLTTRLRGWFAEEQHATGVGLWARTSHGHGSVAFTLMANAFTTNQTMARATNSVEVRERWSKVELPFSKFGKLPVGDLDLFSIEFTAQPGTEFLIDDVYWLGRWGTNF
jgi:hypothetical protein